MSEPRSARVSASFMVAGYEWVSSGECIGRKDKIQLLGRSLVLIQG